MQRDTPESIRESFRKRIDEGFELTQKQPDKAIELADELLKTARESGWKSEEAQALRLKGIIQRINGHFNDALESYRKSLEIVRRESDDFNHAILLNNIGNIYLDLGRYGEALGYFKDSVRLSEAVHNQEYIAISMNNIGIIYYRMGQYDQSLKHHQEALRISRETNDRDMYAKSRNYISILLAKQGYLDEAIKAGLDALKINQELGNRKGMISVNGNLGTYHIQLGDTDKALKHLQEAYRIATDINDHKSIISSLSNIGKIFKDRGDNPKALEYFHRALEGARESGIVYVQQKVLFSLYNLHKAADDHQEALNCLEEYHRIKIDNLEIERSRQLSEIRTQYEFEKKDREAEIYRLRNIELAEANRVLKETRDDLIEAERRNSTLAMAITANHEINQPLMVIRGNLDMLENLLSDRLNDPKAQKYITGIQDAIRRIQGILIKFKKVSRAHYEQYSEGSQMMVFDEEKE